MRKLGIAQGETFHVGVSLTTFFLTSQFEHGIVAIQRGSYAPSQGQKYMADGLNKVMLLGNLGADGELKALPSGEMVLNLRVATSRSWFDKEKKEKEERTEWHSVSIWGKRAEGLAPFLKKGDRIFIEGELRTRSYEKDGEKRYSTDIHAQNILFAGGARKNGSGAPESGDLPTGGEEDDIPFGAKDGDAPVEAKDEKKAAGGKKGKH